MPPPFVKTIREEIYYEYAKLISRSAYGSLQRGCITMDRGKAAARNYRDPWKGKGTGVIKLNNYVCCIEIRIKGT
jgi:hypothetical protein